MGAPLIVPRDGAVKTFDVKRRRAGMMKASRVVQVREASEEMLALSIASGGVLSTS
jgi:hypothetical protein